MVSAHKVFYTLKLIKKWFNEDKFRTKLKEQEAIFLAYVVNLFRDK